MTKLGLQYSALQVFPLKKKKLVTVVTGCKADSRGKGPAGVVPDEADSPFGVSLACAVHGRLRRRARGWHLDGDRVEADAAAREAPKRRRWPVAWSTRRGALRRPSALLSRGGRARLRGFGHSPCPPAHCRQVVCLHGAPHAGRPLGDGARPDRHKSTRDHTVTTGGHRVATRYWPRLASRYRPRFPGCVQQRRQDRGAALARRGCAHR